MRYREHKALGVRTSLLGFGCMRFPTDEQGVILEDAAVAMLHRALEAGVNYIDTAHFYQNSQNEPFVGRALEGVPRENYYLATKLPTWKVDSVADAQAIFALQQERLKSEYFDFYLLHSLDKKRWERMVELGIVEWCEQLQREGKIRRFGFSFHDDYTVFEQILRYRTWDFCQIQLNYLDTQVQAGMRGYRLAEELRVPLIIMEPVKGGALACLPEDLEAGLAAARPEWSSASWALRWVAGLPNVLTVLSGMSSMEQVEDNLATFETLEPLNGEEQTLLEHTADQLRMRRKNGCTGCEYCMPCPAGVDIPEHFRLWNRMDQCRDGALVWKPWNQTVKPEAKADHCIGCGRCEQLCPQHISIPADLARAKADLDAVPRPN
ncbi:aldo/keto reductase [Flavonifractor hominis]|uniref:Aldo/keto reductase n=1 Tax=Flavonifractor hominis TaxID=3133178 RepID=A0ABV1EL64_9FIRM